MSGSLFGRHARTRLMRASLGTVAAAGLLCAGVGTASAAQLGETGDTPVGIENRAADAEGGSAAVSMQTFQPDDLTEQAERLPTGLVEAVRRDLGLSAKEYLANAAAAKLAGEVVASLGDSIRSAWLEGQNLHVTVGDEADTARARSAGAEVHAGDGLTDALAAARAQNKIAYIDRQAGEVVPVDVALRGEPVGEPRLLAQSNWRGGDGFAVSDLLMDYHCSTGFTGTSADGDPRVLTAGHCGSTEDGLLTSPASTLELPGIISGSEGLADTWPQHIGDEVGELDSESFAFGEGKDVGLLDLTADDWQILPEVSSSGGAAPASADDSGLRILDTIDAVAGAPACSTGVTSGWTCGQILDAQAQVPVSGENVTGFLFDACVLPGDSGGAVTVGQYALGINSGSTWRGLSCDDGSVDAPGGDISLGYAVSGGDDNVEALYGDDWSLLLHVGTPAVTSPGEGSTVSSTPTLSGTVEAAAGATVSVALDGESAPESPLEARVSATGRWDVPIDERLDPGTYEYEVTVTHSTAGDDTITSDTVTGTFEVDEVASLNTTWPQPGDTTASHQPTFTGTGQPGATVALRVDGEVRATTDVADDGSWTVTPEDGIGAGRFDAVLVQEVDGASSSITVPDVGRRPSPPVITSPRPGEEVGTDHTFSGVGVVGATVTVSLRDSGGSGDPAAADASALQVRTDGEGIWEVELDSAVPTGEQTIVATQSVDDLSSEPSDAVSFAVAEPEEAAMRADGDIGGRAKAEGDLAETGSSTGMLLPIAVALLVAGSGVALLARRRRSA